MTRKNSSPESAIKNAAALLERRQFSQSARLLESILADQPGNIHATYLLGLARAGQGRAGDAVDLLDDPVVVRRLAQLARRG